MAKSSDTSTLLALGAVGFGLYLFTRPTQAQAAPVPQATPEVARMAQQQAAAQAAKAIVPTIVKTTQIKAQVPRAIRPKPIGTIPPPPSFETSDVSMDPAYNSRLQESSVEDDPSYNTRLQESEVEVEGFDQDEISEMILAVEEEIYESDRAWNAMTPQEQAAQVRRGVGSLSAGERDVLRNFARRGWITRTPQGWAATGVPEGVETPDDLQDMMDQQELHHDHADILMPFLLMGGPVVYPKSYSAVLDAALGTPGPQSGGLGGARRLRRIRPVRKTIPLNQF